LKSKAEGNLLYGEPFKDAGKYSEGIFVSAFVKILGEDENVNEKIKKFIMDIQLNWKGH
jgi:hypothetical protein